MRIKHFGLLIFVSISSLCCCCTKESVNLISSLPEKSDLETVSFSSDKAAYRPGEVVTFSTNKPLAGLGVRYWHLGKVVEEAVLPSEKSWTWCPPAEDYQGYMAEIVGKDASGEMISLGTCGVDVSSEWIKFPRYGYLGRFGNVNALQRELVLSNLNRHHINALQYYEWAYDHHHPLCGTPENPGEEWEKYMKGSVCQKSVIEGYINSGHKLNMASMFYDLAFGVFEWCERDGCGSDWYIYKDPNHQVKDCHPLLPNFRSDLFLVDPNRDEWCEYFAKQISDVYKVYDFDGFHIDQLGDRGTIYDYYGNKVYLPTGYKKVIETMKKAEPSKYLVFNAVSEYGQKEIASAPVDIFYNEVWEHNFKAFKTLLEHNQAFDPNRNSIVCAYLHSTNSGYFNTPAVLMADAAIFSMGGAHLELGENLICDIYWPACRLKTTPELDEALVKYYDFLVAYENVLRDKTSFGKLHVTSEDVPLCDWDAVLGKVNALTMTNSGNLVVHLHNYVNAAHMNWHDTNRDQKEPEEIKNFKITVPCLKPVSRVWAASPDYRGGVPVDLEYSVSDDRTNVTITVDALKYWTMIVIE